MTDYDAWFDNLIEQLKKQVIKDWKEEFNDNKWDNHSLCYFPENWGCGDIYNRLIEMCDYNESREKEFESKITDYMDEIGIDCYKHNDRSMTDFNFKIMCFLESIAQECYDETDYMQYEYYDNASNKIKQWWKKIYWSPKTKVGIKRFNRECQKLGY